MISSSILSIFSLKRPIDYVIRPLIMTVVYASTYIGVKSWLTGLSGQALFVDASIALLIAAPFIFLTFLLLHEQAWQQAELSTVAQTDELTSLPNRRSFFAQTRAALAAKRQGFFLIVDADHFKRINDTLGHPTGDVCLQAVADRIRSILREQDLIGRIGGEEFGVLLFDRTFEELQRTAGRLCFPINVSIQGHPEPLRITVSAGATEIWPGDKIEDVTTRADEALIGAKNNGRERMVLWRPAKSAA